MAGRHRRLETGRLTFYADSQTGNETVRPALRTRTATTKRPPHTAGETGAFLKYSIGQQRAQSMSQSAAKSSAKWPNRVPRASLTFEYLDTGRARGFA